MSPHAVSNFVGDLVEMAKAFEELPQVKANFKEVSELLEEERNTVQSREVHILSLKSELEAAQATIRSLEVARDDAELRFLEADDRANHSIVALRTIATNLGSAITVLDPPKPEPIAGNGNGDPQPRFWASRASHDAPPVSGQSEADPTSTVHQEAGATDHDVPEQDTAPLAKPGPYAFKRYYDHQFYDHQFYVNREQWLAGGGSEADYDWRPSHNVGEA